MPQDAVRCRTGGHLAGLPATRYTSQVLAVTLLIASSSAARLDHLVSGYGGNAQPFRFENVNNGDGTYRFSYDTPTGISARESGAPRAQGPEGPAVTAEGAFSYTAPDGQQISLSYTADENGFHPVGSHLPTPPPIPEAILRSLEYNRQHPSNEGSYNGGRSGYNY
ncbi:pupal cuticle protein 20-like [Aricia agestis]|uniref:pupal cuticle protein 20-like n=1 Tax=Aricia agestis TaxID=91739 RepID=UPI001C20459B|nr:pupal cuticle protein 20-like [Aricia agestis]